MNRLRYYDVHGASIDAKTVEADEAEPPLRPPLEAVRLHLELPDRTVAVRCVRPVGRGPGGLAAGCRQLDGEILAGLRLARLCDGRPYPRTVSRLVGYDADVAEPFALLEPLRGIEVESLAGTLPTEQRRRFQVGLLRAVRLLNAAGVAHRGIGPGTVRWDGDDVQITDFSQAALIGAPRTVAGTMPWQAPEQRPETPPGWRRGDVGPNDDIWAAGRLIFYVLTGEELDDRAKLADRPELETLLADVIERPERRPDAQTLLRRLGEADPPPRPLATDPSFARGRAEFFAQRQRKHPHTARSPEPEAPVTRPAERPPDDTAVSDKSWMLWAGVAVLIVVAVSLVLGR
ncbi:protein kinase domain-containing protein [Actinomadura sp. 3N407]|uniref:protein kinase domain-containing protein n=1 Tax=Actinomadura sp. 3N407 TaxID=3457423 RepID=UPI003FCECF83